LKPKRLLTDDEVRIATALWQSGATLDTLCRELSINRDTLVERRRPGDQLSHLQRRGAGQRLRGPRAPAPTAQEIAHRAAEVRAGWSPTERLNRRAGPGHNVDSWVGERLGGRHIPGKFNRRDW
jgi:hypothetical protein